MTPRYVPFVDLGLSRLLHERWYAAYDYHAQRLIDMLCDKPCKVRQRTRMTRAIQRMLVYGIHHTQTVVLRSDCTERCLEAETQAYLDSVGVSADKIEPIQRYLTAQAWERLLEARQGTTACSN